MSSVLNHDVIDLLELSGLTYISKSIGQKFNFSFNDNIRQKKKTNFKWAYENFLLFSIKKYCFRSIGEASNIFIKNTLPADQSGRFTWLTIRKNYF